METIWSHSEGFYNKNHLLWPKGKGNPTVKSLSFGILIFHNIFAPTRTIVQIWNKYAVKKCVFVETQNPLKVAQLDEYYEQ